MFPVAAATAAGWLLLFFVLLVLPTASRPRRDERATSGAEPPAVVSLLAGRLKRDGLGVTLADLAARGWFRLSGTPGPARSCAWYPRRRLPSRSRRTSGG